MSRFLINFRNCAKWDQCSSIEKEQTSVNQYIQVSIIVRAGIIVHPSLNVDYFIAKYKWRD